MQDGQGVKFDKEAASYDMDAFVPLEVKAGTLVILHGRLVHYSKENTSPASRHAYTMHVVEGKPGVEYAPDNWYAILPWPPFLGNSGGLGAEVLFTIRSCFDWPHCALPLAKGILQRLCVQGLQKLGLKFPQGFMWSFDAGGGSCRLQRQPDLPFVELYAEC